MKARESEDAGYDGSTDGVSPNVVILPLRRPNPELPKQDEDGKSPDFPPPAA